MPERRATRPIHRRRHDRGNTPRVCTDRAGPGAQAQCQTGRTSRACDMAEVESRVADSQTVSHSAFVISGAYHRPSLHRPPSLVLASLYTLYPLLPSLSTFLLRV